ncbi:MAG: hypothetical protein GYA22_11975 [Bacteroidales bacterium]|nr:hypothetical protein [Bacteroidales bacterium]
MIKLTQNQIREIYENLDSGMRCFYNPEAGEILELPDFDMNPDYDRELWQETIEKLESSYDKYIEFQPMSSREFFQMMVDFVDSIPDISVKYQLIKSLNRPKPFRNFKNEINCAGIYRNKWFEFKEKVYCQWIEKQIDKLNKSGNEEE